MKQEIFAKTLPNKTSLHVYRESMADGTNWEVTISLDNESASRYFSVRNDAMQIREPEGPPQKIMERLKVYDALLDPTMPALLVVVDKFGQVEVLRYRLNANNFFASSNVEILPLRHYKLWRMDVVLFGELIEDIITYEHRLIAISKSQYRYNDSYFVSILDLDKKTAAEYRISTVELMITSHEIDDESIQTLIGVPLNPINLTKVLEAVQAKSTVASSGKLVYKFALFSKSFQNSVAEKVKLNSEAFFFVDIAGVPMIMFYTNLNEWYIAPESILKPEEADAGHADYNDIFTYK